MGEAMEQYRQLCCENGRILEQFGSDDVVVKLLSPLTIDDSTLFNGLEIYSLGTFT